MNIFLCCCCGFNKFFAESNEKVAFIICGTIVVVVGIIAASLLSWYLINRVANGIKWIADGCRKRKDAKNGNSNNKG